MAPPLKETEAQIDSASLLILCGAGTLNRINDAVVAEEREVGADQGPRVEVEESDVPAQVRVAGVKAVALGKHHPAARVEARVDDAATARGGGGGPPAAADGSEADVVQQVAGEHARRDEADQIFRQ